MDQGIINPEKKAPVLLIIFSGLSFIPFLGFFFGLVSIGISLFNFKRFKLVFILGLSGIIFSILVAVAINLSTKSLLKSGAFNEASTAMNQYLLKELDKAAHAYKCEYGFYPNSIKELSKTSETLVFEDPIIFNIKGYKGDSLFYYESTSDTFKLFSVGFDGKAFTPDDIYPPKKE